MLLKKIFKPKWQNSNPEIRKEAIAQLDWGNQDDRTILDKLIRQETDETVLHAALKRVLSVDDLITLAKDHQERLQKAAQKRLLELISDASSSLDTFIGDYLLHLDKNLTFILVNGLRETAKLGEFLHSLHSHCPSLILDIAATHPLSKIRLEAADLVTEPDELNTLLQKSKGRDKSVYQKAKGRLQALRDHQQALETKQQELLAICESLEQHAATEVTKYYGEKLDALERQLNHLNSAIAIDNTLKPRIEKALHTCRQRAEEFSRQEANATKIQKEAEAHSQERESTCLELERTQEKLKAVPMTQQAELSALDALVKTQENRWLEATRHQKVEKSEQKRYQQTMSEIRHYHLALQRLLGLQSDLTDKLLLAKQNLEAEPEKQKALIGELRSLLNHIEWPTDYALHPLIEQLTETVGEIQTIQTRHVEDIGKFREQYLKDLQQLDKAINGGELKKAQRLCKQALRDLDHLPAKQKHDLMTKLKVQQSRLEELRDWQGFATRPKQEELCERMDHLAEQHLEPHVKANKIKELQKEWRDLGGSSDQHLWQRFKAAADAAYAPCKAYFEEEEKLKQANLHKRDSICAELNAFISAINWDSPDWKAVDKINRKAREEWRHYYPVDHKQGKAVQAQFNELLAQLDSRLNAEKKRNHAIKQDIVKQAEVLIDEPDLKVATQKAKDLQKQWQHIGITDHKTDRQLWSSFRSACDAIFGRLGEHRKQHQEEIADNQHKAEELLELIKAVAANPESTNPGNLNGLVDQFRALGALGDKSKALMQQFHNNVEAAEEALQAQKIVSFTQRYTSLLQQSLQVQASGASEWPADIAQYGAKVQSHIEARLSCPDPQQYPDTHFQDIVILAEILAERESPADNSERRMALQVERLAAGLHGNAGEASSPRHRFDEIISQWLTSVADETANAALPGLTERLIETLPAIAKKVIK